VPAQSILAEPPVSIVDKVVDKKGTRSVAQAYLEYCTRPRSGNRGQELLSAALGCGGEKYASTFPR